jgi:hypothetical protein
MDGAFGGLVENDVSRCLLGFYEIEDPSVFCVILLIKRFFSCKSVNRTIDLQGNLKVLKWISKF